VKSRQEELATERTSEVQSLWNKSFKSGAEGHNRTKIQSFGLCVCS